MNTPHPGRPSLKIHAIRTRKDNWAFVLVESKKRSAVLVDCPEAAPIQAWLSQNSRDEKLTLSAIFLTHHHHDHVAGLHAWPEVPTFCSTIDRERIDASSFESLIAVDTPDGLARFQDASQLQSQFRVLTIPGHTRGQLGLWATDVEAPSEHHFFTGDTLFQMGCGRTFEGTHAELFQSLQQIKALPSSCKLYVGHDYTLNNIRFARGLRQRSAIKDDQISPKISDLLERIDWDAIDEIEAQLTSQGGRHTLTTVDQELRTNVFLCAEELEVFSDLRTLKDHW